MADGAYLLGVAEMNKRIANIIRKSTPDCVKAATNVAKKKVLPKAIDYTPMLTGALRSTGKVGQPEVSGHNVQVPITFGSDTVDYAVYVHENLEANHPIGQAKFLETAINEEGPNYARDLAAELRGTLG